MRTVYETEAELDELQRLLDASNERSGAHVRSIFSADKRLSARQVSRHLQGVRQVAAAAVNRRGEPRVAPIDAVLYHGKFYLSTDATSLRARSLSRNPAVSLTYFEGADPMIVVNGRAAFIRKNDPGFPALDSEWERAYGTSILELGSTVLFIRVDASQMLAFAMHPERFPDA